MPNSDPRQIITPLVLVGLGLGVGEGLGLGVQLGLGSQVATSTRGVIIWQGVENRHNTGRPVTAQPDLTGQWHLFSYTQRHYPILPCEFQAPGRLRCLKQSDRVKYFPCSALGARGWFSFISWSRGSNSGPNTTDHELWPLGSALTENIDLYSIFYFR